MTERWLPVPGMEDRGYEVSDHGRVRRGTRILASRPANNGAMRVSIWTGGPRNDFHVHRLVISAFIPGADLKRQWTWIDGDKSNNRPSNLIPRTEFRHPHCRDCEVALSESNTWYVRTKPSDPARASKYCKTCSNSRNAARLERKRISKYGVVDQCQICSSPRPVLPSGRRRRFHLDHDHVTGVVRGQLCNNCNVGIGMFKDAPSRLRAAAEYLESSRLLHDNGRASMSTSDEQLKKYADAVQAFVDDDENNIYDAEGTDPPARFMLVEKSVHDDTLYLTCHDSPEAAADYHDGQEYPEDWRVEELQDLETGASLEPTTSTSFR